MEFFSSQDKYLLIEGPKWGALIALSQMIVSTIYLIFISGNNYISFITNLFLVSIIMLPVMGIIIYVALKRISKKGIPMNKYMMALSIVIFGGLILTLINWAITRSFSWGVGILPIFLAFIVAAISNVDSQGIK